MLAAFVIQIPYFAARRVQTVKCELQLLANWWQKTRMKAALSTLAIQRSTDAEMRRCHPRCDVRMADAICYAANTRLQAVWVWENRSGDFHRDYRRQCRSAFWVHLASVLDKLGSRVYCPCSLVGNCIHKYCVYDALTI